MVNKLLALVMAVACVVIVLLAFMPIGGAWLVVVSLVTFAIIGTVGVLMVGVLLQVRHQQASTPIQVQRGSGVVHFPPRLPIRRR